MKHSIIGLVLCGGMSTRMGHDKGSKLLPNGKRWVEHVIDLLTSKGLEVFVSINTDQVNEYTTFLNSDRFIVDIPLRDINGPLRGLISTHRKHKHQSVFVIPCDMIDFSEEVIDRLLVEFNKYTNLVDIVVPTNQGFIQPLTSIYSYKALKQIDTWFREGEIKNKSMMHVVKRLKAKELVFDEQFDSSFQNFNHPEGN